MKFGITSRIISPMAACAAAICLLAAPLAQAQTAQASANWPDKPVRIVVPFPPGGSTDAIGRMLAAELSKELGQNVLVENRGGANGNIGSAVVAKADPDGYTLLISGVGSNAISYGLYSKIPYQDSDFSHISLLATGPNVLVVNPDFPARTFAEFVEVVKANPGKYSHASSSSGSSGHLSMEMLKARAGLDIIHVPYKGGAAAITDMIGGRVEAMFLNQDTLLPQVRSGKLRALAVTSTQRNPAYPDIPTVAESGYPGFVAQSWFGLSAPAGTPPAVINRLHAATVRALAAPDIRQKLEAVGFVVVGSTPAELSAFIQSEISNWGEAARLSGVKMD